MRKPQGHDSGFTLIELMTVVLIIGILVTVAVPIYTKATSDAEAKGCLSNQRTISGAVQLYLDGNGSTSGTTAGLLSAGESGWYGILIPDWIKLTPTCPNGGTEYLMTAAGGVAGDGGSVPGFKAGHVSP